MKAIIPAAGIGTRLRPHTYNRPKAMVEVAGKPILAHIIDRVNKINPEEIVIIVGYQKDMLINWINKRYPDLNITFITQQKMLGLGHAIYMAKDNISKNEELLIILGDTIVDIDIKKLINSDYSRIVTKQVDNPKRFGIAELNKDKFITNLVEKPDNPSTNKALIGVYYIKESQKLFESLKYIINNNIKTKGEFQITDALNYMVEKQKDKMKTYDVKNWFDCGTIDTLLKTNKFLLDKFSDQNLKYNYPNTVIIPPVAIGEDVKIKNSIIGPYVSISDNISIDNSIIKNSLIYSNTKIKNFLLRDSIIGDKSNLKKNFTKTNIGSKSFIEGE
ncbi:MAG: NTP transferase domain-containing protein [Candidatus Mcinerneyibacterium aminivorans]|uniref:NTP transferase domain-containing protein n=1 Tax=Candidatus Mcinerneyibacterium aminivorans TaxID=2703815 RepID=A0A5D0MCD1_9BACT|nr:MAG: NTP transferase domain-containing protein [Candidatus Mcinerneyibacterium aminivorans]